MSLDYAFARYYNQRLGRFMSGDPLGGNVGDPQSLNRYSYVGNNPINRIDPTGMFWSVPSDPSAADMNEPWFWDLDPGQCVATFGGWLVPTSGCWPEEPVGSNEEQGGGSGGGGGAPTAITRAIAKVQTAISSDPNCLTFLNSNGGDALATLAVAAEFNTISPHLMAPTRNRNGSLSITNAQSPGFVDNQQTAINPIGAFYQASYQGHALTTDRGRIRGGTDRARAFILLHELGHVLQVLGPDSADQVGAARQQKAVNANDKRLERECKTAIKSF